MERRKTVLVVDDEAVLRETVAFNLQREGYSVLQAADGSQALRISRADHPDLILLDLMMPGMDGLAVCTALRQHTDAPVLMLTAKGEEIDRVVGLEVGADDYITKPFSMRELMARVKAHLRRADVTGARDDVGEVEDIVRGDLVIDPARYQVRLAGRLIPLRPKEYELLVTLAARPGMVLTRDVLLRRIWGYDYAGANTRTLDVHVTSLRKKLEADPANPRYIQTVRGAGYRFGE